MMNNTTLNDEQYQIDSRSKTTFYKNSRFLKVLFCTKINKSLERVLDKSQCTMIDLDHNHNRL